MEKWCLSFIAFFTCAFVMAQTDTTQPYEAAKLYMRQGDYANAELFFEKALQKDPSNTAIAKDFAFNYYFAKDNNKALSIIKPLLDKSEADDQVFQIGANIYRALDMTKDAEATYKKGLKRFPKDGLLYNDYGELLSAQQNTGAIDQWEKGIELDPSYSGNYFNAAKYYYFTPDKIWGLLYAEIFLNLEPQSSRTAEVKNILLDSYKKLLADAEAVKPGKEKITFEKAFVKAISKELPLAASGLTAENLTMIRTRFILNWFETYAKNFPFKLFDFHQQLLQDGLFDAYNQWIFGAAQNLDAYQTWTGTHTTEYSDFNTFQKGRIFKLPAGQYYKK